MPVNVPAKCGIPLYNMTTIDPLDSTRWIRVAEDLRYVRISVQGATQNIVGRTLLCDEPTTQEYFIAVAPYGSAVAYLRRPDAEPLDCPGGADASKTVYIFAASGQERGRFKPDLGDS